MPDGKVVSASGHDSGDRGIWLYTLEVPGAVQDVTLWYGTAYGAANWEPVNARRAAGGGVDLEFAKGGAQAVLRVTPGRPGYTRVEASLGLGVPTAPVQ